MELELTKNNEVAALKADSAALRTALQAIVTQTDIGDMRAPNIVIRELFARIRDIATEAIAGEATIAFR